MTLSPKQFNKIAMKDDLDEVKRDVKEIKSDVKRMLGAVEAIATEHRKFDQELAANIGAHDRFEARISKLESAS